MSPTGTTVERHWEAQLGMAETDAEELLANMGEEWAENNF
jgi:hypothetical protein